MKRESFAPRPEWEKRCREIGFDFFDLPSSDGSPYWCETAGYCLSAAEVDALEDATNTLHSLCEEVVSDIVESGDYPQGYGLSDASKRLIEQSWKREEPALYGRFDLAFDGSSIKMLEYNADTPTSLLEAAVAQWQWQEDRMLPDQFNSIHERLIEQWKTVGPKIAVSPRICFTATKIAGREDWGTLEYLMETALQSQVIAESSLIVIEEIGWDAESGFFTDLEDRPIVGCFKLYPWEWMMADDFREQMATTHTRFIEPAWKMLLSSKALLPELWKRNPGHPLLLPAHYETEVGMPSSGTWARKPVLSREGANVAKIENGTATQAAGSNFNEAYNSSGYVLQAWTELPQFDGFRPVIGSWVIGDESAGIGIREDRNAVTGNDSHFVPHYFI